MESRKLLFPTRSIFGHAKRNCASEAYEPQPRFGIIGVAESGGLPFAVSRTGPVPNDLKDLGQGVGSILDRYGQPTREKTLSLDRAPRLLDRSATCL